MSLLNFSSLLKEAIDKQKQDVNNELHSDDASKGNKVDTLPTPETIKADKNDFVGDKADKLDPKINESTMSTGEKSLLEGVLNFYQK